MTILDTAITAPARRRRWFAHHSDTHDHAATDRQARIEVRRHAVRIASLMRQHSVWDQEARYVVKFADTLVPFLDQATDAVDLAARLAALEQAVANVRGEVNPCDRDRFLSEARTFYDFYTRRPAADALKGGPT
ncbi:hypothetical protein ACWDA3_51255 [Nonomuraea rubra]